MAVGLSFKTNFLITKEEFYAKLNEAFSGYNKQPNFLTYLVDNDQHCFTPMSVYYTAGNQFY